MPSVAQVVAVVGGKDQFILGARVQSGISHDHRGIYPARGLQNSVCRRNAQDSQAGRTGAEAYAKFALQGHVGCAGSREHGGHVRRGLGELIGTELENDSHRAQGHQDHGRRRGQLHQHAVRSGWRMMTDSRDDPGVQLRADPRLFPNGGAVVAQAHFELRVFGNHASTP